MKVLLADDERAITASVSFVLKHAGHDVDAVHDGEDALLAISQNPGQYQILITDHLMVRVTGLELVQKLCKTAFKGKIVVLSAFFTEGLENAYRSFGVGSFIPKPFDVAELRAAVEDVPRLDASRAAAGFSEPDSTCGSPEALVTM